MPRRFALAFSFALTVVVSFAVVSLSSQAGWLNNSDQSVSAEAQDDFVTDPTPPFSNTATTDANHVVEDSTPATTKTSIHPSRSSPDVASDRSNRDHDANHSDDEADEDEDEGEEGEEDHDK